MEKKMPMLTGYRVLDLTQVVAGPTCTRVMAELGAEVIKIELAPFGDRTRAGGLKTNSAEYKGSSQSTYFFQQNHSKQSIALDFKSQKGREIIKALVAKSDVLVENFAPGVMRRAGLSYDDLKEINPGIVMCSISLAGQSGPLSTKPGYDYVGQAYAGITDLIGDPHGDPAMITMAIGDCATGIMAAMGVGFALLHRERTGEGQYIEASLLDTYFQMHEVSIPRVSLRGPEYVPKRTGTQHPDGGPTGVFRYGSGQYITLAVLPHQWNQLVETLRMPELLEDPRFKTARLRRDNNDILKERIEQWLQTFPTRDAALTALDEGRIPCAPVLTLNEAIAHPHMQARQTVRRVHDKHIGEFDIPGMPVKFSRWEVKDGVSADLLGEHNESVLADVLGMSAEEIGALYDDKVLVRDSTLPSSPQSTQRTTSTTEA